MLRSILAVSFVIAVTVAPPALGSQGGKYRGSGSDAGSRANITGTSTVPSTGGVIATVRVQNVSSDGLIQFGHIKHGSSFTSNCGPAGTIGYMVERKAVGGSYLCNAFFGSFGSNQKFSVLHVSGSGWNAYLNGSKIDGPYALGFTSGLAFAVGEYNGTAPSSYSMTFGPSGGTAWQYTVDRTNWITISSATNFNDGGWIISSLPSPFSISR
jgi:hypothetical protein